MNRKHKQFGTTVIYIEHFLIFTSTVTGCISISVFTSLTAISIGISSFAIVSKICAITARN